MATLQERNRIAREIHDNVGHMLTRALLQTGALAVCVKEEPLKASVAALQETLDSAMTSIRSSVHKLHDDAIPLEKSVQDCLQPLKDIYHITLTYDISEQIPSIVKLCLLGVLKESLSNVVKNSFKLSFGNIRLFISFPLQTTEQARTCSKPESVWKPCKTEPNKFTG